MAVTFVVIGMAGCTSLGSAPSPVENPREVLQARPTLGEITARYQEMRRRVQAEVDRVLGPRKWIDYKDGSTGSCGFDFPGQPDAATADLNPIGFDEPIPDNAWPQLRPAIADIIKDYGFTTDGQLAIDQPGNHELNGIDPRYDAHFSFGSQQAASMEISTGCHLKTQASR